jgi:hypothetical protein
MMAIIPRALTALAAVLCALGVLAVAGCGAGVRRLPGHSQSIATASCVAESLAPAPFPQEVGVYRAGPLTLAVGVDLAQHPEEWAGRRTSGSEAIVVLTGGRPAVLSVDRGSRRGFSLQFTPYGRGHPSPVLSDGRAAVRFPACFGRRHRFGGGVLFRGTGCARLRVGQRGLSAIPMLIPIGNTLRGCAATSPVRMLGEASLPFLGVSCPVASSIACDRVGVGVHLRLAATLVVVQVAGRLVTLSPPTDSHADLWLGYLDNAGLTHGPLDVHLPAGVNSWSGSPEVDARVRVTALFPDGHSRTRAGTVLLHPGFG